MVNRLQFWATPVTSLKVLWNMFTFKRWRKIIRFVSLFFFFLIALRWLFTCKIKTMHLHCRKIFICTSLRTGKKLRSDLLLKLVRIEDLGYFAPDFWPQVGQFKKSVHMYEIFIRICRKIRYGYQKMQICWPKSSVFSGNVLCTCIVCYV